MAIYSIFNVDSRTTIFICLIAPMPALTFKHIWLICSSQDSFYHFRLLARRPKASVQYLNLSTSVLDPIVMEFSKFFLFGLFPRIHSSSLTVDRGLWYASMVLSFYRSTLGPGPYIMQLQAIKVWLCLLLTNSNHMLVTITIVYARWPQ